MNQLKARYKVPSSVSILVCIMYTHFCHWLFANASSTGTTNSAVAIMEGKVPRIIENAEGKIFYSAHIYVYFEILT